MTGTSSQTGKDLLDSVKSTRPKSFWSGTHLKSLFSWYKRRAGKPLPLHELVKAYADAVARHGANSQQALKIRDENADNAEFVAFAHSLVRIRESLKKP